jgi:hypothetical protein
MSALVRRHEQCPGLVEGHGDDGVVVSGKVCDYGLQVPVVHLLFFPRGLQVEDRDDARLCRVRDVGIVHGAHRRHRVASEARGHRLPQTPETLTQGLGRVKDRRRVTGDALALAAAAAPASGYQLLFAANIRG